AGLVAVGLSIDLFILAICFGIQSEWYGKLVGVAAVWAFFALLILGLILAAQPRDLFARALHVGAIVASLLGGVFASVLIIAAGGNMVSSASAFGIGSFTTESVLRPLAAVLVVNATLWLAALATTRVEKSEA